MPQYDWRGPTSPGKFWDFTPSRLAKIASPKVYTDNPRKKIYTKKKIFFFTRSKGYQFYKK